MKVKVGVVGITSITGGELWNILSRHRYAEVNVFCSDSQKGNKASSIGIGADVGICGVLDSQTYKLCCEKTDVIFLCLSHNVSMKFVKEIYLYAKKNNLNLPKIIDLSGDFRLKEVSLYEEFYQCEHIFKEIVPEFVYGLPEIYKEEIKKSKFVANPGCYPTTILLGLAPIIKHCRTVIIDSKSGYSGGGKKLIQEYESSQVDNTYCYNVEGKHRHIPEIEEQLSFIAKEKKKVFFTPHVVPQYRGMFSDIYVEVDKPLEVALLYDTYKNFYQNCPFVRVLPVGSFPQTKNVVNTNFCEIGFATQKSFSLWVKIFVAIDNLIKGASGQAVQNMNLMFGFEEKEGLV